MRILAVNHEFPPLGGGGANANYYIARELVRQGHEVTVITSRMADLPARESVDGIEVIRLQCLRRHVSYSTLTECLFWVVRAVWFCALWAARHRPDIVQSFFALPNGPVAWAASRAARCPYVVRLGGGDVPGNDPTRYSRVHRLMMPITRMVLRHAAGLIVNSRGLLAKAREAYPELEFAIIPNGVALDEFNPDPGRRNGAPMRLLCVSRLVERKGIQYLIPALANLRRRGLQFHLRVVGDGPMLAQLRQAVADEGIADCVQIDGAVPHEQLPEVYREADLFVLPSLAEGMPNVMLEAISSGLAVIGTRVAGMDELVREGRNGWLVEAGDSAGLERALEAALRDPRKTVAMGEASRALAEEMSWSRIARSYDETWTRVLGGAPATHPTERVALL